VQKVAHNGLRMPGAQQSAGHKSGSMGGRVGDGLFPVVIFVRPRVIQREPYIINVPAWPPRASGRRGVGDADFRVCVQRLREKV